MALLFCDGFDHVDDNYELLKWDGQGSIAYEAAVGRTSGWGMRISFSNGFLNKQLPSSHQTLILGTAFYSADLTPVSYYSIRFKDTTTDQVQFKFQTDGSIEAFRGTTSIGSTATGVISAATWCYLEFKVKIDNTTGTVDVRKNGVSVLSLSGKDTQVSGNASCNNFTIANSGANADTRFDDLYLCNDAGTKNNDFLGDVTITTLYPTSDGNSSDFTPSTGSDNYAMVDEAQLAGTTDYNESTSASNKDLYGVTTFSGSGSIKGVQVCNAVLNPDTGSLTVRALVRSGVTPADNEGASHTLSQTMTGNLEIWEQEPEDAVDWTAAKINAAEFGVKHQS